MKSPNFSAEAIAASAVTAYERSLGKCTATPDAIPKGFRPISEWMTIWDKSWSWTRCKIKENVADGLMERKVLRVKNCAGFLYPTPHFKAVK